VGHKEAEWEGARKEERQAGAGAEVLRVERVHEVRVVKRPEMGF
jgi:hypothetical protein